MLLSLAMTGVAQTRSETALSWSCNGCHGPDGVSQGPSIPSIAGLNAEYMTKVMEEYQRGRRVATIMDRIARGYKPYELRKIARYYARKPWRSVPSAQDEVLVQRGRELHERLCAECHEDAGRYQDQDVPRLAGQSSNYLLLQLQLYASQTPRLPQPSDMADKIAEVAAADLPALSAFYSAVE